jgi:hypothetical protein
MRQDTSALRRCCQTNDWDMSALSKYRHIFIVTRVYFAFANLSGLHTSNVILKQEQCHFFVFIVEPEEASLVSFSWYRKDRPT